MQPPAFEFIEIKDVQVDRFYSYGKGVFQRQGDNAPSIYSFLVQKNLAADELQITICSPFLRRVLALTDTFDLDFAHIAAQYSSLRARLSYPEKSSHTGSDPQEVQELRLLVEDFLLDRNVFCGFDIQHYCDRGIISAGYWQDMQHSSTMKDLNVVDRAFQSLVNPESVDVDFFDTEFPSLVAVNHSDQNSASCRSTKDSQEECTLSHRSGSPPKQLSTLESIRYHLGQLDLWCEGWTEPVNVEDCVQWSLENASGMSQAELNFLDCIIGNKSDHTYQIKALLSQPDFKDSYRLTGDIIIFNGWGDDQLAAAKHSLNARFRSVRRLDYEEKKLLVTSRLHQAFNDEHRRFRTEMTKHKIDANILHQRYHRAWDKGVATIRRILQGKRPNTLEKICRLLQVAFAMGSQDPSNQDFRMKFMADLDRWRTIVPRHSLHSFDAIAEAVWNKTFDGNALDLVPEYGSDDTLLQLQELLSGLISRYPQVDMLEREIPPSYQPPQTRNESESAIDISYAAVTEVLDEMTTPRAYSETRKLPIGFRLADSILILLMTGAIFGFIITLFVILRSYQVAGLASHEAERQNIHFENHEERNLFTLTLYMGLWPYTACSKKKPPSMRKTLVAEATSSDASAGAVAVSEPRTMHKADYQPKMRQLQCDRCDKQLSNLGNLNRHIRYDCGRKARFPCRNSGCRMVASRKAYRDKHERSTCPLRWASAGNPEP